MSFTYRAGSTTPDYSGLFEIPALSLRICNVPSGGFDPTFHPYIIPPISSTCPIRYNVKPIPRGGARVSEPLFDSWTFDVPGWFLLDDVADVQAAIDYLTDRITVAAGWMSASFNAPGWAEPRLMLVQKGGPVVVDVPPKGDMAAPARDFTLTFTAADPIKYATTDTSTVITSSTPVPNNGNAAVPLLMRFDGPVTGHIQTDAAGVSDSTILLNHALSSGQWVSINTRDGSYLTNTGIDLNPYIAVGSGARLLQPGNTILTKSSGGGGTATETHSDGWE